MSDLTYKWRDRRTHSVPAQIAGEEVARIREESGKFFTPSAVVEAARPEAAPLHGEFEWDDERAAAAYRHRQAGDLVRSLYVVRLDKPTEPPVRAFVSVKQGPPEERVPVYTTIQHALATPELREQVIDNALRDFESFKAKYDALLDLSGVVREIRRASLRAGVQASQPAQVAS